MRGEDPPTQGVTSAASRQPGEAASPSRARRARLSQLTERALPAGFVLYFGSFGAMLSGMSTRGLQMVSLAVLVVYGLLLRRRIRSTPLGLALLAVVLAQIIALLASPASVASTSQVVIWLAVLAVYWVSTAVDLPTLDTSVFAVLVSVALVTLYQALNYWLRVDPLSLPPRLGSTLWNPNNLAFVMLLGLALAAKHRQWFWLAIFAACLALTGSLTSVAAGLLGALVFLLLNETSLAWLKRHALLLLPAALALGAFVGVQLQQRQQRGLELGSLAQRLRLWQVAAGMFRESPLVGMGPGSFQEIFLRAGVMDAGPSHQHAHNLYLHTAAETGIVGLAALGILLVAAVLGVRAAWRRGRSRGAALGIALLVALLAHGVFDYVYWIPSVVLLTLWVGRVLIGGQAEQPLLPVFSRQALRANARLLQVALIGMAFFRVTAEQDFRRAALAQYTTGLSLVLSVLLVLALPARRPAEGPISSQL